MNRWNDWFLENKNNDLKKKLKQQENWSIEKNQFLERPLSNYV